MIDPRYRFEALPKKLYLVKVPMLYTYTPDELDLIGLPADILGDGSINHETPKELTTVMLNISKMIDIYSQGGKIVLINKADVSEVYQILEKYLNNIYNAPVILNQNREVYEDRLDVIEKFTNELFHLNKGTVVRSLVSAPRGDDPFKLGIDTIDIKMVHKKQTTTTINYVTPDQITGSVAPNPNDIMFVYDNAPTPKIDYDSIKRKPSNTININYNNPNNK